MSQKHGDKINNLVVTGKIGQNSSLNNNNDNNNGRGYEGGRDGRTSTSGEDAVKRELERLLRQARKKK